ncbi:MAG: flagellar hook-basal body complex protein, partial [Selenomonadaceae bacterium]|nr:flagellar hook-basal body complex protein [Selenomonadaceae bacterium]
ADAVVNSQAITALTVTYTDGTSEVITPNSVDYSDGNTDTAITMAGKSIRIGQNRSTRLDYSEVAADGTATANPNALQTTAIKTVASVSFTTRDALAQEAADTAGVTDLSDRTYDNATDSFTSGTFTIYDSTDSESTLTTQSVNVDGTNVIAATLTLSDGSSLKVSSGFYEIGHSVPLTTVSTVYDAEGNMHSVTLLTDKSGGNEWRTYISPTSGQKGYQSQVTVTESDGTSTTISLNRQVTPATATTPEETTTSKSDIYFTELGAIDSAKTSGGSLYLEYSNGNKAQATTVAIDFNDITQYAGSNTLYPTTDGNSLGTLNSISIDVNGVITGTYTNGVIQNEAQIAVAQFINSAGLDKSGTSMYKESNNSGAARVGTVSDFGFSFTPSALEMSNVELASELVDMIVTQRGFQANSKSITVGDEMLETIVNMKR